MRASIQPSKALCIPDKRPTYVARSPLLVGRRRKKTNRGQISAFPPEISRFAPLILAHRDSPGSSTIELPSVLAEPGAYSPDRACHGTLVRAAAPFQDLRDSQCLLPLSCHHLPKGTELALGRGAPGEHHLKPTIPPPRQPTS